MNLDKIICIIRNLNEDAPTVSVSGGGVAGVTGDPPVNLKKRKKPPILARGKMPGSRSRWKEGWGM